MLITRQVTPFFPVHKILHTQRWARAFRDDYHAAVNTNNGNEALNKVLKYIYQEKKA